MWNDNYHDACDSITREFRSLLGNQATKGNIFKLQFQAVNRRIDNTMAKAKSAHKQTNNDVRKTTQKTKYFLVISYNGEQ